MQYVLLSGIAQLDSAGSIGKSYRKSGLGRGPAQQWHVEMAPNRGCQLRGVRFATLDHSSSTAVRPSTNERLQRARTEFHQNLCLSASAVLAARHFPLSPPILHYSLLSFFFFFFCPLTLSQLCPFLTFLSSSFELSELRLILFDRVVFNSK